MKKNLKNTNTKIKYRKSMYVFKIRAAVNCKFLKNAKFYKYYQNLENNNTFIKCPTPPCVLCFYISGARVFHWTLYVTEIMKLSFSL